MTDLKVFIAVIGSSPVSEHMFSVRASNSTYVAEFKEMIYAEAPAQFQGSYAVDLVLWKVPLIQFLCLLIF